MRPITFDEFDGGITDKDVPGRTNRYSICDNLLIDIDKKLIQRDGFDIYSSTAYQLVAGERVGRLVNFDQDSELLGFQNKKAYAIATGAWAEVQGPGGGSSTTRAFNYNNADSLFSEAQWQHHLIAAATRGSFTATINISTGYFTATANSVDNGFVVKLSTTGALPTGLMANVPYYVVQAITAGTDTFKLSETLGGSAISLSGTQSGTHTVTPQDCDPPVKIYRDNSNVIRLRTAGLPEWPTDTNPTDGGLADAITLANDIRTKMIAHFGANGATAGTPNNSSTGHHISHADLAAQASAVGASTAATTLATLITLLNTLRAQYSLHIADAQQEDPTPTANSTGYASKRKYHMKGAVSASPSEYPYDPFMQMTATANTRNQPLYLYRHYLNFSIQSPAWTIPSSATIADVLPYLNDLRDKWNWHTYASITHLNAAYWQGNDYFTYLGSHATSYARVETYTWAKIVPNYGPLIQLVTDLHTEFLAHRTNDMHIADDTVWAPPSGVDTTPDDFWEAITLLGWLAHGITYHALEADPYFCANGTLLQEDRTATTSAGSPSLSLDGVGGFAADKYKYMRVVPMVGTGGSPYIWTPYSDFTLGSLYNVTASDTATPCVITCASNFTTGFTSKRYALTSRHYHFGNASSQLFDHRDLARDWNELDFTLGSAASLQGFSDLAVRIAGYLKNHTKMFLTAQPATADSIASFNSKKYQKYYLTSDTSANSYDFCIHSGQDQTNYPVVVGFAGALYLSLNSASSSGNTAATQMAEDRFNTAPRAASFNYKAVYRYDYRVGTKYFTDRSAPSGAINTIGFVNEDYEGGTEKGKYYASLTSIKSHSNAANENWAHTDTTNFRKEIYRTKESGTRYYKCDIDVTYDSNGLYVSGTAGDITNATTTFSDYTSDTFLADQLELYSNDGSPENNKPPLATYVHRFRNVVFYVLGNKVYQSIPNDPDSVPSDFYEEFEEDILAVSSTKTVPIALGKEGIYRLTGGFDSLGRGSLSYDPIFSRTGTVSSQAVVQGDNGVFFAGKDGFYFTDGYQCMRVTDLPDTFKTLTSSAAKRNMIQGAYDSVNKRIYWTVQTSSGSNPDKIWILDLQFGIKPDATPITTLSKTSGFNPTAVTFLNGQLYYADGDGYVFVQTSGRNIDLVKNTGVAATSWDVETVRWDFKSCNYHYGTEAIRKYFTRVTSEFEQQDTNVSVDIVSDADKGRITSTLPVIRSRKLTDWGDSKLDWISSVYSAKAGDIVDEWRWFKGDGSLRANYRALEFKTAYCVIVNSGDMGTITIANVSGNVYSLTLTSKVATRKWPLYSVGYYVKIGTVEYPVTVRTSDSVARIDATGLTAPTAGVESDWELWGYPKNERIRFLSYSITTDLEDDNQTNSSGPVVTGGQNA